MESRFINSPSSSPEVASLPFVVPQAYDTTSDSSSPSSPAILYHTGLRGTYDILPLEHPQAAFFSPHNTKFPVEYTTTGNTHEQDRRRKPSVPKDTETMTNMHLRRRAQNRASQRAFRERKEKHVKGLENQLRNLHEKHEDLLQSYSQQTDEVTRLNERIKILTVELDLVRANEMSFSNTLLPDKFDAVPYPNLGYGGPESYLDMKLNTNNIRFGQSGDPS